MATQVGFATKIVQRYFDIFIPRILRLAEEQAAHPEPFVYQIHSWIASLYVDCVPWRVRTDCPANPGTLRCPSPAAVARFDKAVRNGTIAYTASPFNIDAQDVGDPALFEDEVRDVAGALDVRYGRPEGARVWSNVDVKGFARASIPLLRAAGVNFLSIGQNGHPSDDGGSHSRGMQPAVGGSNATMFRWRDKRSGEEVVVLYHDGYGGPVLQGHGTYGVDDCLLSPNGVALASYFRSDNAGPPESVAEVQEVIDSVQKLFPNARVVPSSFDRFAEEALPPSVAAQLPVFDSDWGDQWLTGTSTDPRRLATYRAVMRSRAACLAAGRPECAPHSAVMRNVTRWLAKVSEHTQGAQGEQWSPGLNGLVPHAKGGGEMAHWSNAEFAKIHSASRNLFESGELTWLEARVFSELAVAAVPAGTAWSADLHRRLAALDAPPPSTAGLRAAPLPTAGASAAVSCGGMRLSVDGTASLTSLALGAPGREWTGNKLMSLTYNTYNKLETWDTKANLTCDEPGCANPKDAVFETKLTGLWHNVSTASSTTCQVVTRAVFDAHLHIDSGAPLVVWTRYTLTPAARAVSVELLWENKTTTRLPESFMLNFRPKATAEHGWGMDIMGEWSQPNETAAGTTNQWQKAVWRGVRYSAGQGLTEADGLAIDSYDAAMVCPIVSSASPVAAQLLGGSTPLGEGISSTPMLLEHVEGMAFNLFNNMMPISGFAQWYPFGTGDWYQQRDEASLFRFLLRDAADGGEASRKQPQAGW